MPIDATCSRNDKSTSHNTDLGIAGRDGLSIVGKFIRTAAKARLRRRPAEETDCELRARLFSLGSEPAVAWNQTVADQRPDGQPAVGVTNLLAFASRTRGVRDRHFGNLLAHAAQLGSHFGAKLETLTLQADVAQQ